jgi:hypothetical protein
MYLSRLGVVKERSGGEEKGRKKNALRIENAVLFWLSGRDKKRESLDLLLRLHGHHVLVVVVERGTKGSLAGVLCASHSFCLFFSFSLTHFDSSFDPSSFPTPSPQQHHSTVRAEQTN